MYKEEYDDLLYQLNQMFRGNVTLRYITPCHDEDYPACYAVIYDGIILGNPDLGLEYNARNIYEYLLKKVGGEE